MNRRTWAVAIFTLLYVGVASPIALARGNTEFLFYIAILILLLGVVALVHFRVGLSPGALWCLSFWGLAHMAGGLVPIPEGWPSHGDHDVLYSLWIVPGHLKYDHLVHAYGFGTTSWVCWQALRGSIPLPKEQVRPTLGRLTLSALGGLGFGALNEVIEFVATLLVPQTNVGGYINTGWDLVANTVGAVLAVILIRITWRPPKG
jgi:hypothetical protein